MVILVKNVDVYAPKHLGKKDVLIAGGQICQIPDSIELTDSLECEVITGDGKNS